MIDSALKLVTDERHRRIVKDRAAVGLIDTGAALLQRLLHLRGCCLRAAKQTCTILRRQPDLQARTDPA